MAKIKDIKAREILDSRGNPTIETTLLTDSGDRYTSSVPSGASTGAFEAIELRDNDNRYHGKGVLKAVSNVNNIIAPALIGEEVDLLLLDKKMIDLDGTENKSNIGANAILSVSMSVLRAQAGNHNEPLYQFISQYFNFNRNIPTPLFNIVNGGEHGSGGVSFQEFMLLPKKDSFSENLRYGSEFFHRLREKIREKYGAESVNIGDEGGFVPKIEREEDVFNVLKETEEDSTFLIDVASTEFYKEGYYHFKSGEKRSRKEMIDFYKDLNNRFSLIGLEDPLEENDFAGWGELRKEIDNILIVGDDLLVTNTKRMITAKENNSCNAIILKINQIGSISEAVEAVRKAKEYHWKLIVSHRSGETNDNFIADFAVGIGAHYIKSGAPQRGERVVKYNRLLEIEDSL